jgi:ATP/maltotriose-dependent transcriptional regulator MalT
MFSIEALFQSSQASICLLDSSQKVIFQNQASNKLCGLHEGKKCSQTCVVTSERASGRAVPREGVHFVPNNKMNGQFFDVYFLNEDSRRMVVLSPLRKKFETWLQRFKDRDLSRREMDVAKAALQGFTNQKIADKLRVSKATLKTHLNNIYKKLPEIKKENWR